MPDTLWKLALALRTSPEDLIYYARPWWVSKMAPQIPNGSPSIIPEIVIPRKYGPLYLCNEPCKNPICILFRIYSSRGCAFQGHICTSRLPPDHARNLIRRNLLP